MTAILDVLARVFLAPPAEARMHVVAATVAPAAAVCGPEAAPLACALALILRRRGAAVVCVWGGAQMRGGAPGSAAGRRLASSLDARGIQARAAGHLVVVSLAEDAATAAGEVARAAAATGDAPTVLALCGPREPDFDRVLAAQDVAVVATGDAPDELVRLGVGALEDLARRAVAAPALGAAAAWAAGAGLLATPAARRALATAAEGLR
jgi:hypothetical protein